MNTHPYLRAYMAGTFVPTIVVMLFTCGFVIAQYVCGVHPGFPLERFLIFPLAFVPNIWGAWNLFYVSLKRRLPLGVHGALLVLILAPLGFTVGNLLSFVSLQAHGILLPEGILLPFAVIAIGVPCGFIVYYLVWKYVVGFLNNVLGIA